MYDTVIATLSEALTLLGYSLEVAGMEREPRAGSESSVSILAALLRDALTCVSGQRARYSSTRSWSGIPNTHVKSSAEWG